MTDLLSHDPISEEEMRLVLRYADPQRLRVAGVIRGIAGTAVTCLARQPPAISLSYRR